MAFCVLISLLQEMMLYELLGNEVGKRGEEFYFRSIFGWVLRIFVHQHSVLLSTVFFVIEFL